MVARWKGLMARQRPRFPSLSTSSTQGEPPSPRTGRRYERHAVSLYPPLRSAHGGDGAGATGQRREAVLRPLEAQLS